MADSFEQMVNNIVDAKVSERLAAFRQLEPVAACISTKEAMRITEYKDTATFLAKFTHDPDVIKRRLCRKEGSQYKWLNPEWGEWYHDVYWRRDK